MRKYGCFPYCIQHSTGLAGDFVCIFPKDCMEKHEQTSWPTEYLML